MSHLERSKFMMLTHPSVSPFSEKKEKNLEGFFDVNTLFNILFHKCIFIKGTDQILALEDTDFLE